MQLHIFGENKSYKHFYEQRLAYKTKGVPVQQTWQTT